MNADDFAQAVFDRLPKKLPSYRGEFVLEVLRLAAADVVFEMPVAERVELEKEIHE